MGLKNYKEWGLTFIWDPFKNRARTKNPQVRLVKTAYRTVERSAAPNANKNLGPKM